MEGEDNRTSRMSLQDIGLSASSVASIVAKYTKPSTEEVLRSKLGFDVEDAIRRLTRLEKVVYALRCQLTANKIVAAEENAVRCAIRVVSQVTGIHEARITGREKPASVALARQIAYLLLWESGWSYKALGRCFGRDHGAIMFGVRAVRKKAEQCQHTRMLVETAISKWADLKKALTEDRTVEEKAKRT